MLSPGSKSVISKVNKQFTLPEPDVTRKHLFVLNTADQTVSCIDTSNDTVESTITLPSSCVFRSMHYRQFNDSIYVWGTQKVCKINANPADANFKEVTDMFGNTNAATTISFSGLGVYNYMSCAYDPVNDIVFFTNNSNNSLYYYDFRSLSASAVNGFFEGSYDFPQNGQVTYVGHGRMAFASQCGTMYVDSKTRKRLGFHNFTGGAQLPQSLMWIKKYDYVYRGSGSIVVYDENYLDQFTMTVASGVSAQTQMIGCLSYSPYYDIMFGARKQTGDEVFIFDIATNTYLGTFNRTNKDTNETYSNCAVYSLYANKFYLRGAGTTGTVTRVHKFDPALWVANGKTNLADMIDGYITVGSLVDIAAQNVTENKMCMNHLVPH